MKKLSIAATSVFLASMIACISPANADQTTQSTLNSPSTAIAAGKSPMQLAWAYGSWCYYHPYRCGGGGGGGYGPGWCAAHPYACHGGGGYGPGWCATHPYACHGGRGYGPGWCAAHPYACHGGGGFCGWHHGVWYGHC